MWSGYGRQNNYHTKGKTGLYDLSTGGETLFCENYRAITILNAAYTMLSQILFRRLSPLANRFVGSYQAGFTDGRSTTDQIFTVRRILQKCREYQISIHHLFTYSLDRSSTAMADSARIQLPHKAYKIDTGHDEWSAEQRSNLRCLIGTFRMP